MKGTRDGAGVFGSAFCGHQAVPEVTCTDLEAQ